MKQGDTMLHKGVKIKRRSNSKSGNRRYVLLRSVKTPDKKVYSTKRDAKAAIDAARVASTARRRERDDTRGFAEVGSFIEYRKRRIERMADVDGTKRYRVPGMAEVFKSIDAAVFRIAWAAAELEHLENPPTSAPSGLNRNGEK